jgi:hypothetical protein
MPDTTGNSEKPSTKTALSNTPADKVRKVIEDLCKLSGTSIAIEERLGETDKTLPAPRRHLHVTYTGEPPMPYPQWFKLVDSIDAALDPSGLINWEYSELSEESDTQRHAAWAVLAE